MGLAWPLAVLVLGLLARSVALALLVEPQRQRAIWTQENGDRKREHDRLAEANAALEKRVESLENWRITLKNRNGGRD